MYVYIYRRNIYIYTYIHTGEICISMFRVLQEGYLFFSKVEKLFHASGKDGEGVVSGNGKHRGNNPKLDGMNENMHAHTSRKELLFDLPCIRAIMLTNYKFISYLAQNLSL